MRLVLGIQPHDGSYRNADPVVGGVVRLVLTYIDCGLHLAQVVDGDALQRIGRAPRYDDAHVVATAAVGVIGQADREHLIPIRLIARRRAIVLVVEDPEEPAAPLLLDAILRGFLLVHAVEHEGRIDMR